jgi:hypothetical protein
VTFIEQFEIDERQLLVFAIDSAANIQKAASIYLKALELQFAVTVEKDQEEEDETQCDLLEAIDCDGLDDNQSFDLMLPAELIQGTSQEIIPTSYKIPCVAHQLQLAISKFCETPVIEKMLEISKKLSAKLRTPTIKSLTDKENLPRAKMDQTTRWSSKFHMTKRLAELKEFCQRHQDLCQGLKVTKEFWCLLDQFNDLVEPFTVLTSQLQSEQLKIYEFNEYWTKAMLSPMINSD